MTILAVFGFGALLLITGIWIGFFLLIPLIIVAFAIGVGYVAGREIDTHIGHDTAVGDPLILDLSSERLRVLTAMHGVGSCEPICVACSLEGFRVALNEIRNMSRGRENPVLFERNPLSVSERSAALQRIEATNPGVDLFYWKHQMQDYE
jgi:Na+-transporting methylmalonyl-CoA/oxaloacetate decarboxylase gamma subunit